VNEKYDLSGALAKRLLNAAPDPTVIVDHSGTIVFANSRTEEVFGYSADEITGQPVEYLMPTRFRDSHPAHRRSFSDAARSRPMGAGLELYGLHKDGREFPVEISLSPLETPDGMLISSAIRDVSAQRETERALADADRAKSRFLAAASHDLRQPLQALTLLNRAAARLCSSTPEVMRILDRQQKALDSMSALLNSLLDISKLDAGKVRPQPADIALQDVFSDLQANFSDQASEKKLSLHVGSTDLAVRTDRQLLTQLLSNLVSNSIRYTSVGEVSLHARDGGEHVVIVVSDTGIGIPGSELERIFAEFYQVERPNLRQEGLGLGLSIVKRLAGVLDVELNVQSCEGRGTEFRVQLLRAERPEQAVVSAVSQNAADGGRILIVDDDFSVADATRLLLELEGFEVQVATNELDAISVARVRGARSDHQRLSPALRHYRCRGCEQTSLRTAAHNSSDLHQRRLDRTAEHEGYRTCAVSDQAPQG
jgi:two-component system, sensor histidine kinase